VVVDCYSTGRVALLGDAAYGNTLGGFGTGLAVVGAYVLAGELKVAGGDHRAAFTAYQQQFQGYAEVSRRGSAGPFLAPGSPLTMRMRNWTSRSGALLGLMMRMADRFATDMTLKRYRRSRHRPRRHERDARRRHGRGRQNGGCAGVAVAERDWE
jgi:2-polyprenyl-6-methoxyphenol hydroxylase-like FAD-dependent oxidoreductase